MSTLRGKPDVPANTPLTAQLTYTRPYQQGERLGIGTATLTYDWTDNRWEVAGQPFDMVAARFNQNDPAPSGEVRLLFKTGAGAGQQGGVLNILPVETAAGEVDITKPVVNVTWVGGADFDALKADALAATAAAEAAAQQVTDAITDLSAERQAVADSLTATAQTQAANDTQQAGNNTAQASNNALVAATEARLAPLRPVVYPAGTYIGGVQAAFAWLDIAGQPLIWWDTAGAAYLGASLTADGINLRDGLTLAEAQIDAMSADQITLAATPGAQQYVAGTPLAAALIADATTGAVLLGLSATGSLIAPGGVIAPNIGASVLPAGYTIAADGGGMVNGVRIVSSEDVVQWGDSLSEGAGSTGGQNVLAQLIALLGDGRQGVNRGLGGNKAEHIAARAGAAPAYATVAGGSIPATTTAVEVTPTIRLLDGSGNRSMAVTLGGIPGTLAHDNTASLSGPYYYTRAAAGAAVSVGTTPQLIGVDNSATADHTHLIWAGHNDLTTGEEPQVMADRVIVRIRALVDNIRTPGKRFGLLTLIPGARVPNDSVVANARYYAAMQIVNAWVLSTYPSNSVDVTTPLITYGGNSDGSVPASLRVDIIHLNNTGYGVVAAEVKKFFAWKGY